MSDLNAPERIAICLDNDKCCGTKRATAISGRAGGGRCRTVTESPDLWVLGGVRWQFFGPFTFKQQRLPERIRQPFNNHKSVKSEDTYSTSFSRAERLHPSGVRLRSARYARLRSASPRRGGGGGKKDKLQKEIYTPEVHPAS